MVTTNGRRFANTDQRNAQKALPEPQQETDKYGRTLSERTIYLTPEQAEMVNLQVELYGDESEFFRDWDSAWQYIVRRGFAEVTRQRKVKEKQTRTKQETQQETVQTFARLLAEHPDFVTNPSKIGELVNMLKQQRNGEGTK